MCKVVKCGKVVSASSPQNLNSHMECNSNVPGDDSSDVLIIMLVKYYESLFFVAESARTRVSKPD